MTASTTVETAHAAKKPRIALWDNARFVLIVLVVVGHVISTVRTDSSLGFALYAYIYLFHMPAMILLAGMFSRAETTPKPVRSAVQLLVTWLVWEGIWALIHLLEGEAPGQRFLVSPAWTLWFLVSLATMRILLPYIARLRHPFIVSTVLALAGGLSPVIGTEFSAARTLTFLPFFVAGWLFRERGMLEGRWFTRPTVAVRATAGGVFAVIALVFVLAPGFESFWRIDRWLTWRDDYATNFERAPIGAWQPEGWLAIATGGIAVTAVLLAIAMLMTVALLVVMPRRTTVYTRWGSQTLYVYLLHAPIVYTMRSTGVIDLIGGWGLAGMAVLIALAVALAVVLSLRWVDAVFRPVVEPRVDWLLSRVARHDRD